MRRKVSENGWGRSHHANKAKTTMIERHKAKVRAKHPKQPATALKAHYKAKNGVMIGNFSGPGVQGWTNGG